MSQEVNFWYYEWFGKHYNSGLVFPFKTKEEAIKHYEENNKQEDTDIDLHFVHTLEVIDVYTGE